MQIFPYTVPCNCKPVDGCSSKGITVCNSENELREAYIFALEHSESKEVIIEKYIQNNGIGFSVWYIVDNGMIHLNLTGDKYVVDPFKNTSLISAASIYPSKYTKKYIESIDTNVRTLMSSLGVKNGVFFMQALIDDDKIYFHEMGIRLSGAYIKLQRQLMVLTTDDD